MIFKWPYSAWKPYNLNCTIHCCWMELYKNISFNEKWHCSCADSFCVIIVLGFANELQLFLIWQFVELLNFEWRVIENVHYWGLHWVRQGRVELEFALALVLFKMHMMQLWLCEQFFKPVLESSHLPAVSREIMLGRWYKNVYIDLNWDRLL